MTLLALLLFGNPCHIRGAQLERLLSFGQVPNYGGRRASDPTVDYQGNVAVFAWQSDGAQSVIKFGPNGSPQWSIPGLASSMIQCLTADRQGNILVGGSRWFNNGDYGGFVQKLSPSGMILWTSMVGINNYDEVMGIAVDGHNNILVTGMRVWGSGGDNTQHGYAAKLTPNGTRLWATHFGGTNNDYGMAVTADSMGNVLVAGNAFSPNWASGGYNTSFYTNGSYPSEGFVLKLDPNGNPLWSSYLGGSEWDGANGVACDAFGNVVVTGATQSPNWVSGGYRTHYGRSPPDGAEGGFLVKLSANGTHLWSTYLGPWENGGGVAVDAYGNIFVTGEALDPAWDGDWARLGFDPSYGGQGDAFIEKFTPYGSQVWASYLGGSQQEAGSGIAAAPDGSMWVAGGTTSTDLVAGHTNAVGGFLARVTDGVYFQGVGNWSDLNLWTFPPTTNTTIILPYNSALTVNIPGAQGGTLRTDTGSLLTVQPAASLALYGSLVNNGTMNVASGGQVVAGSGTGGGYGLVQSGGSVTIDAGGTVALGGGGSGGVGLTQSGGSVVVNGTLNASGPVQVQGGHFTIGADATVSAGLNLGSINASFEQSGGVTTVNGTLNVRNLAEINGGTVIFSPSGTLNSPKEAHEATHVTQSGGQTTINGTINASFDLDGGTVNGSGTINGNAGINGGALSPGESPGVLTVSSNFILNTEATLRVELAGRAAGQFDQVKIGGHAGLAGGLTVTVLPGFAPALGDRFPIVAATQLSGMFSRLEVPPGISVTYSPTSAVLVVTGVVPVQIVGPTLAGANLLFTFPTATNQSYTVQFNDHLGTAEWQFYTNLTGTGALTPVAVPRGDQAQRFFRVRQP